MHDEPSHCYAVLSFSYEMYTHKPLRTIDTLCFVWVYVYPHVYAKGMNVVHLLKSIIAAAVLLAYYNILLSSGCTYEGVTLVFMLLVVLLLLLGDFVDVIDDVNGGGGCDGDSAVFTGSDGGGGYYQFYTFTACTLFCLVACRIAI
uniref:Uncharacterized protein n=1 Tax=Glossina brevipalpis TaxID=37001 RepID=A0A1A9W8K6_9MUSC